jgi:hypothetical protein
MANAVRVAIYILRSNDPAKIYNQKDHSSVNGFF